MRQALIIALTVFVTATLTVLSMNVMHGPATGNAGYAPTSMDIMQMMRSAQNLPEERFDAY